MKGFAVLVAIVGLIVVWAWIYWYRSERLLKKFGGQRHFSVGRYAVGLEDCNTPVDKVECVVSADHFVFARMGGRELGRIPRDAVEEVAIDDRSQITQRLTATRIVALGVFALAAPKKNKIKEWCVGVRWSDKKRMKRLIVFEFTGSNPEGEANEAATKLMKYVRVSEPTSSRPPSDQVKADGESKLCPYCAETIKAAAKVCRYCNREVPQSL